MLRCFDGVCAFCLCPPTTALLLDNVIPWLFQTQIFQLSQVSRSILLKSFPNTPVMARTQYFSHWRIVNFSDPLLLGCLQFAPQWPLSIVLLQMCLLEKTIVFISSLIQLILWYFCVEANFTKGDKLIFNCMFECFQLLAEVRISKYHRIVGLWRDP